MSRRIKQPQTFDRFDDFIGGVLALLSIALLMGFGFLLTGGAA